MKSGGRFRMPHHSGHSSPGLMEMKLSCNGEHHRHRKCPHQPSDLLRAAVREFVSRRHLSHNSFTSVGAKARCYQDTHS